MLLAASRALVARVHCGPGPVAAAACGSARPQLWQLAQYVKCEQRRSAARCLPLRRGRPPNIERIGEHLGPRRRVDQLATGGDHGFWPRDGALHRRRDGNHLIGNRLHRPPEQLCRLRAQRKARDHRPSIPAPVRTPLAGPEGKDCQAMAVGRECRSRALVLFRGLEAEGVAEPAHHVAALTERAAEHVAVAIDAVDEGSPWHAQAFAVEQDAEGARGANRGTRPARTDAPCAEVGQPTVAEREIPGSIAQLGPTTGIARAQGAGWLIPIAEWRELFRCDAGEPERGSIPLAAIDIEQPGSGCDRMADPGLTVELLVEIFAERDPARRPAHSGAAGGVQPAELRRPVAGVEETARARMVGALVETQAHLARFRRAARVGPGEELRGRATGAINTHEAVPVARDTDAQDGDLLLARHFQRAVDALGDEGDERVRIGGNLACVRRANLVWEVG